MGARKGGINEQIKKTAQEDPGLFWALNNGITIVADTATKIDDTSLKLKRFSIVNGCQTTSSLVRAGATSSAKVLVRVIAAKAGLKNEIVRYNNSQNAVKIWTVRAVDDVQEQLRNQFKAAHIDYAPKQSGSRRRRDANTIELDKVAQYLAASHVDYLIQAIDNKSELFDEPYQTLFTRGTQASSVYLAWLAGGAADEERQQLFEDLVGDDNRALLGVTSVYWIVYCMYRLLDKFSDIKSAAVTLSRMTRPEFKSALRKYAKEAASIFWDAAVDTYDHEAYGSIKSTLRSQGFLKKMDSKLASRIARVTKGKLPDLSAVAKSIKS